MPSASLALEEAQLIQPRETNIAGQHHPKKNLYTA